MRVVRETVSAMEKGERRCQCVTRIYVLNGPLADSFLLNLAGWMNSDLDEQSTIQNFTNLDQGFTDF